MLAAADLHWWYRGRRRIVRSALETLELPRSGRLLDVGCGGGQTLELLSEFGRATGIDPDPASVELARARGNDVEVAALPELPFANGIFAAVTCLDVLEHLDDDAGGLAEIARVTDPRGALVVTVPAYEALWSAHDEANDHKRRYRARTLHALATRSGWHVRRTTYFNSLLLPAAALVRVARRRGSGADDARSELTLTPRPLNGVLEMPMRAEAALLRRGRRLPAGLSLLAVLTRS